MPPQTYLSIIIPAYNEERRLPGTLDQIFGYLADQDYCAEVLVVENGSNDLTLQIAQDYAKHCHLLRVIHEAIPGKGLAVKTGMLAANGKYRIMMDADLSMPVREIGRFMPPKQSDFDILIASREAPGSVRYNEPNYRHIGGRFINTLVQLLVLPGIKDSQCGFKCFRDAVAIDLFQHQTLIGWSFDIELLYIARTRGYQIEEIPIPWYFNADSKVKPIRDAGRMIVDLIIIRRNAHHGIYKTQVVK